MHPRSSETDKLTMQSETLGEFRYFKRIRHQKRFIERQTNPTQT